MSDPGPGPTARPTSSSRWVQEQIKAMILGRKLQPGALLPPEVELAQQLGVGRGSVREAVKTLQALGIVEVRHGYGTFVGRLSLRPLIDELTFHGLLDLQGDVETVRNLIQIRAILEVNLIRGVAASIEPESIERLEVLVEQMHERAARGEHVHEQDRLFHEQLYRSVDNALVSQMLQAFWDVLRVVLPNLPGPATDPRVDALNHERILVALAKGDPDQAAAAMAQHFVGVNIWAGARPEALPDPMPRARSATQSSAGGRAVTGTKRSAARERSSQAGSRAQRTASPMTTGR